MICQLMQRGADAAQKRCQPPSHVRAAVRRRQHQEAADPLRHILCEGHSPNDSTHTVPDEMNAALALVAIKPPQQSRQTAAMPLDSRPQAGVAPIDDLTEMLSQ